MLPASDLRLALESYFPGTEITVIHDSFMECFNVSFTWQGQQIGRLIPEAQLMKPGDENRVAGKLFREVTSPPPTQF